MNKVDLERLVDVRLTEAQALFKEGLYDGAYYLAGYAVECALKVCIAAFTNQHDYPDKELAQRCYTHNIEALLGVAKLKNECDIEVKANRNLRVNWGVVKDWDEQSRYERKSEAEARDLLQAITDPTHGVLPWIKARW